MNSMKIHWPKIVIPEGFDDAESYLRQLVYEGAKDRYADVDKQYLSDIFERIEDELGYLKGYEPYFIMVHGIANFCKSERILFRIAYGYAVSSIVNYCLGITDVDPTYISVYIERFFLKGDSLYPDINLEVDNSRKEDIVKYLKATYGEECVLNAGVGYLPTYVEKERQRVPVYSEHFSAICIFDKPYSEVTDVVEIKYEDSGKTAIVPKLTYAELESLGYIYIDIIGMKSLNYIDRTLQMIEKNKGERIEYEKIPLYDPATYEYLTSGDEEVSKIWYNKAIYDIFFYVKPQNIHDLTCIFVMAHHRMWDELISLKTLIEKDEFDTAFWVFDDFFHHESHGFLIYQEQILLILHIMSNLGLTECERIRRQMQNPDQEPVKSIFLNSVKEHGFYDVKEAERIWIYFMKHQKKTSSLAHFYNITVDYYRRTWLRVHYPEEFKACYILSETK